MGILLVKVGSSLKGLLGMGFGGSRVEKERINLEEMDMGFETCLKKVDVEAIEKVEAF